MNSFTIYTNNYLEHEIQAFYHSDYQGGDAHLRNTIGTTENIICTLKNQFKDKSKAVLIQAGNNLIQILKKDLVQILEETGKNNFTVCVIPRAKAQSNYLHSQLIFREAVSVAISKLTSFSNGTNYIIRHTDTRTTHLDKSGYGGDGDMPYPGITKETCTISDNVRGEDIILVDDLYTKTVNIDEDVIQALLDKGAKSVVFYAVGKTKSRSVDFLSPPSYSASDTDDLPF